MFIVFSYCSLFQVRERAAAPPPALPRIPRDSVGYKLLVRSAACAVFSHISLLSMSLFQLRQGWSGTSGLGKNETG